MAVGANIGRRKSTNATGTCARNLNKGIMEHKEFAFEKECRKLAREAGWLALKLEKNGHKGVPDDLFISPQGRCVLIEFKKDERQRPRPEQQMWLQRFPGIAFLIGSREAFVKALEITPQT